METKGLIMESKKMTDREVNNLILDAIEKYPDIDRIRPEGMDYYFWKICQRYKTKAEKIIRKGTLVYRSFKGGLPYINNKK